ncbi:hypothetical protein OIU78_014841, partial [Salix suchowensis]
MQTRERRSPVHLPPSSLSDFSVSFSLVPRHSQWDWSGDGTSITIKQQQCLVVAIKERRPHLQ